jgi:hypothetical protein
LLLLATNHDPDATTLSMSPKKTKAFKKTTEVKRQARLRVGSPPAAQTHLDRRKKLPKHKKRARLEEGETVGGKL